MCECEGISRNQLKVNLSLTVLAASTAINLLKVSTDEKHTMFTCRSMSRVDEGKFVGCLNRLFVG